MAAEQVGPRSRIVLLRNTVEGQVFCTAHKSQTVYHGPVVYLDAPYRRLALPCTHYSFWTITARSLWAMR